jgi:hypothetical protein
MELIDIWAKLCLEISFSLIIMYYNTCLTIAQIWYKIKYESFKSVPIWYTFNRKQEYLCPVILCTVATVG